MDTPHLPYAPDLTDAKWILLEPHLSPESPIGRPRLYSLRIILNAIFYQLRTGGSWRLVGHAKQLSGGGGAATSHRIVVVPTVSGTLDAYSL